jgi:hypothetical protein
MAGGHRHRRGFCADHALHTAANPNLNHSDPGFRPDCSMCALWVWARRDNTLRSEARELMNAAQEAAMQEMPPRPVANQYVVAWRWMPKNPPAA